MVIELKANKDHVLIPKEYNGEPNCGSDVAVMRIPDQHVARIFEYMNRHANDERYNQVAKKKFQSL